MICFSTKVSPGISKQEHQVGKKKLKNDYLRVNTVPPCMPSNHSDPCGINDVEILTDGVSPIGNRMDSTKSRLFSATISDEESARTIRHTGNSCGMFDKMQRLPTIFRTAAGKIISSRDGGIKNEGKMNDIRKAERQNMDEEVKEKYAYLLSATSYAILYIVLSADLRRNNNPKVIMGLRLWSLVLMLILYISYYLRRSPPVANVVRTIAWGLLFISALFISILLQLQLTL